jgi:hypothetical protein
MVSLSFYGFHISAQDTSQRFCFQSEYLGFYPCLVIRKVAMCQIDTLDESFQNHHYLAGTRVTIKLALRAGPSGQLLNLAILLYLDILTVQNTFGHTIHSTTIFTFEIRLFHILYDIYLSDNINSLKIQYRD